MKLSEKLYISAVPFTTIALAAGITEFIETIKGLEQLSRIHILITGITALIAVILICTASIIEKKEMGITK